MESLERNLRQEGYVLFENLYRKLSSIIIDNRILRPDPYLAIINIRSDKNTVKNF